MNTETAVLIFYFSHIFFLPKTAHFFSSFNRKGKVKETGRK